MRISTRARYGVRLMLALARHYGTGYTYLKDIAKGEGISEKYLSQITIPLKGVGLINASRGARGGYILARPPSEITIREIVDALEGDSCLVDCVRDVSACPRVPICASRDIWMFLGGKIAETLNSVTLERLVRLSQEKAEGALLHDI
jgi:Rrf2 family protein